MTPRQNKVTKQVDQKSTGSNTGKTKEDIIPAKDKSPDDMEIFD